MFRIKVKDLRFFSYHGFYPEEQTLGNEYFVSIVVTIPMASRMEDDLSTSVNYEELYAIAKREMNIPQKLLETVAKNILDATLAISDKIEEISISIIKNNPPFGGDSAKSEVELTWIKEKNNKQ